MWSCTDSSAGTFGTCRPQPADCESFRSAMLERFPDLTSCHDERIAQCFNLGRDAHCAPSAEICDQLRALAARQHGSAPSKCYAASAPADAHRE